MRIEGIDMDSELEDLKKILDNDEMVLESFKPNRKRFILINILFSGILFWLISALLFVFGILGLTNVIAWTNEDGSRDLIGPLMLTIMGGIPVIIFIMNIVSVIVRYRRTIYVVTNKRVIVRSGFIGVDYKSLELKNILSIDVRVDFLDKLVKPNTGSIMFGSAINNYNNGNNSKPTGQYSFSHIDNPYEVYKRVKERIPEK